MKMNILHRFFGLLFTGIVLIAILFILNNMKVYDADIQVMQRLETNEQLTYDLAYVSTEYNGLMFETGAFQAGDGIYYLFLPWWCRKDGSTEIYAAQDLGVEGKKIKRGENFFTQKDSLEVMRGEKTERLIVLYSSEIPTLWLKTENHEMEEVHTDKNYVAAVEASFQDKEMQVNKVAGNFHCRGNVSFTGASKKSYVLETDEPVDFLDMGYARKWILTSNCFDGTMLRNYLTYQLAQRIGLEYSPEAEFVDLYIDGKYFGIYLLGEKIENDVERVAVKDLQKENEKINGSVLVKKYPFVSKDRRAFRAKSPEDLTGGYLVEFDLDERWVEEDSGFVTKAGQHAVIHAPKYATVAEVDYISGLFQDLEDTLLDENDEYSYQTYIDMESFACKYILEELCKNLDANKTSQYFYKYDDSVSTKIFAGPAWDYDRAWGNGGTSTTWIDYNDPTGFLAKEGVDPHPIWAWLCKKDSFYRYVKESYFKKVLPEIEKILNNDELNLWKDEIANSVKMDRKRWEQEYWNEFGTEPDYEEMYRQFYEFVVERTEFLNRNWN